MKAPNIDPKAIAVPERRAQPAAHSWLGAEVRDDADVHAQTGSAYVVGLITRQHLYDQQRWPN